MYRSLIEAFVGDNIQSIRKHWELARAYGKFKRRRLLFHVQSELPLFTGSDQF